MADDRTTGTGGGWTADVPLRAVLDDEVDSESEGAVRPGADAVALDAVSEEETIGDVVDVAAFARRLPSGWNAVAEVVQFRDEPLAEALIVRRNLDDPRLLLKPVELTEPRGSVECFERRRIAGGRERIMSTDSIEAAVRAATNWAHQQRAEDHAVR